MHFHVARKGAGEQRGWQSVQTPGPLRQSQDAKHVLLGSLGWGFLAATLE